MSDYDRLPCSISALAEEHIPSISMAQFEEVLGAFARSQGTELVRSGARVRQRGADLTGVDDPVAVWLAERGLILGSGQGGALYVECPWKHEHTSDSGLTETAWFVAGSNGYERGGFRCLHAHCDGRGASEFEQAIGYTADDFEVLPAVVEERATAGRAPISATPYVPRNPATIPPRPWVYGRQLLRGSLSLLIAPGAAGKTSLLSATAISLASGLPILGYEVHGGSKRVWFWNLEDSLDELARSIEAVRGHYNISDEDIGSRLFVDSGPAGAELCLARQRREGVQLDECIFELLTEELIRRRIDVIILDPFVSLHGAGENDNGAIDAIVKRLARMAFEADCAVLLAHHTSKLRGAEVGAEAARGASSLINAARSVVTINRPSDTDATKIGVPAGERQRYFRLYDDKNNRAPPAASSDWFRLVSVDLGNGDNLAVVERWMPPEVVEPDVDLEIVARALGTKEWRASKQSPGWAGYPVARHLGWDIGVGSTRTAEQSMYLRRVEQLLAEALAGAFIERVELLGADRKQKTHLRAVAALAAPCGTEGSAAPRTCGAAPLSPLGGGCRAAVPQPGSELVISAPPPGAGAATLSRPANAGGRANG